MGWEVWPDALYEMVMRVTRDYDRPTIEITENGCAYPEEPGDDGHVRDTRRTQYFSGYLAAHWGGANGFARPGYYPGATDPSLWRDEVVLGIAEHDNGWWETEAMPLISDRDGLPIGIGEAASPTEENEFSAWRNGGFDRWLVGIDRITELHPYGALLLSLHAYWLLAVAFEDLTPPDAEHRRHFVFGAPDVAAGLVGDPAKTRAFLDDLVR